MLSSHLPANWSSQLISGVAPTGAIKQVREAKSFFPLLASAKQRQVTCHPCLKDQEETYTLCCLAQEDTGLCPTVLLLLHLLGWQWGLSPGGSGVAQMLLGQCFPRACSVTLFAPGFSN